MGVDAEMFVRVKRPIPDEEIDSVAYDLVEAFGTDPFLFWGRTDGFHNEEERRVLRRIEVYEQDGPEIYPEPGETFIEVSLFSRYYGVGYERGLLPELMAIAAYLEQKIPGSEVWYGGDSSGILAEKFGPKEREKLFSHFVSVGHSPYAREWGLVSDSIQNPTCEFCHRKTIRNGWGGQGKTAYGAFSCHGCGFSLETRDGGQTWKTTVNPGGREVKEAVKA